MRIFGFPKRKTEELVATREVLMEKWFEGGTDVIDSLTKLLLTKIAPALKKEMEQAGFENVLIGNEHWYTYYLSHKKLLSGKSRSDWSYIPNEYCWKINSFETYSKWVERAEKMVEKISEIKRQVEEMKARRDGLINMVEAIESETK
jgi:hypothetical protein